ncbi:MAG TPA: hypothetical protein VIL77_08225 [Gaiellaceae bacterium]
MKPDNELKAALTDAGYNVQRVLLMPISSDGTERRSVLRDTADLVRNVLIFSGDELDPDAARALINWTFAWIHARRDRGIYDDTEFVSVYGPDGTSILLTVPVPK